MSADFWAGYISGAVGILIGNPLDLIKVRLQGTPSNAGVAPLQATGPGLTPFATVAGSVSAATRPAAPTTFRHALTRQFPSLSSLLTGTAAPILGYGALNALLFVSYNRAEDLLNQTFLPPSPVTGPAAGESGGRSSGTNLWATWLAGAVGGLATWVVSTPTELVKCRAQMARSGTAETSSFEVARQVLRAEGLRGLYLGGAVTAVRDSVGYGFYFWSYELCTRYTAAAGASASAGETSPPWWSSDAARVLLCGGVAGVVTWASVFPLDVVKTRLQTQPIVAATSREIAPLLGATGVVAPKRLGGVEVAREAYRESGLRVFFRGLGVCSIRAFVVNAVQWAAYEWIMQELGHGRSRSRDLEMEMMEA